MHILNRHSIFFSKNSALGHIATLKQKWAYDFPFKPNGSSQEPNGKATKIVVSLFCSNNK